MKFEAPLLIHPKQILDQIAALIMIKHPLKSVAWYLTIESDCSLVIARAGLTSLIDLTIHLSIHKLSQIVISAMFGCFMQTI